MRTVKEIVYTACDFHNDHCVVTENIGIGQPDEHGPFLEIVGATHTFWTSGKTNVPKTPKTSEADGSSTEGVKIYPYKIEAEIRDVSMKNIKTFLELLHRNDVEAKPLQIEPIRLVDKTTAQVTRLQIEKEAKKSDVLAWIDITLNNEIKIIRAQFLRVQGGDLMVKMPLGVGRSAEAIVRISEDLLRHCVDCCTLALPDIPKDTNAWQVHFQNSEIVEMPKKVARRT